MSNIYNMDDTQTIPNIPNINSTNGNNYLTLYSKLTYNIV